MGEAYLVLPVLGPSTATTLLTVSGSHYHKGNVTTTQVWNPGFPIGSVQISPDTYARAYSSGDHYVDYYPLKTLALLGIGEYRLSYSGYSDYPELTISIIVEKNKVVLKQSSTASGWSGASTYTSSVTVQAIR